MTASDHDFDYFVRFGRFESRFGHFLVLRIMILSVLYDLDASDHNVSWFLVVSAASDYVLYRFVHLNFCLKQFVRPILGFEMICKTNIRL